MDKMSRLNKNAINKKLLDLCYKERLRWKQAKTRLLFNANKVT